MPAPAARLDELCEPGLEVFTLAPEGELRSPFAEENEAAARLGRRRSHFLAARLAAHAAMARLGAPPSPIANGEQGEPLWPLGLTGSLSHTHGLAVAAVGRLDVVRAVGVDVEKASRRVDQRARRQVCHPDEPAWLDAPPPLPAQPLLLLLAAKEVVFKAYFPPTRVRLGFRDAVVRPEGEGLVAELRRELPDMPPRIRVLWRRVGEHLVLFGALPP